MHVSARKTVNQHTSYSVASRIWSAFLCVFEYRIHFSLTFFTSHHIFLLIKFYKCILYPFWAVINSFPELAFWKSQTNIMMNCKMKNFPSTVFILSSKVLGKKETVFHKKEDLAHSLYLFPTWIDHSRFTKLSRSNARKWIFSSTFWG